MALDGIIINSINHELQRLLPLRINKIAQVSKHEVIFECYHKEKINLLVSTDSVSNRLLVTSRKFVRADEPSHFIMLLRKYCENGIIQTSKQIGLDRIIEWTITNRNDLGDLVTIKMMIELMGKYANIILVGENHRIIDAFHRIAPYENNKRTIFTGAKYELPEPHIKKDPFSNFEIDSDQSMTAQFHGVSPLLGREMDYRLQNGQNFQDIMASLTHKDKLYLTGKDFHLIPLTHLNLESKQMDLMEGLDTVYDKRVSEARIKEHTGDLRKLVKRELNRLEKKLPKLKKQYYQATNYEEYGKIGDLLLTYGADIKAGQPSVDLIDFEGQTITVELDKRYDGIQNAKRYYNRYHKSKKAINYLQQQIEITTQEIDYYQNLLSQLDFADVEIAKEIREELIAHGLIRKKKQIKKQKEKAHELHSYDVDGIKISVGHSNLQNEYLTFKKAHKDHLWFHVKDGSGAHVVANASELSERQLRFAANLAAFYSKYQLSSSVAVNYTHVRELKKIPKAPMGMVSLGQYQTIFIDPQDPENLL